MLMQNLCKLKLWKRKPLCLTAVVFGIFFLYCLVRILLPCKEYEYEGGYFFETGAAAENVVIYKEISLGPGVYRVELDYYTDTDLSAVCNVADGTVFSGALLSNGEHVYSALGKTGYDMWLFEKTEDLQVTVSYSGRGSLAVRGLKIVETNRLWTMLLTCDVFFFIVILLVMTLYCYQEAYGISREKKNAFFFVAVIGLAASIPYLSGYTITGADLTYHLQRIEGVKDGLLGGQFPVRLEPRWVYDHGYANGIFYCNTFLYFPALLRLVGFPVSISYNLYCVVLNFVTAWISYYCFRRIFGRQDIGIVCSALYTLSIFRIYKLVITSAVGEGTATAFLPLIFYGLYRAFTEDPEKKEYRTVWLPVMLGYGGLIQSHVLTCEITAFVTLCFCVLHIRKVFRKNTFLQLLKGAMGALLISLWYLVPFLDYYLTQDIHIKHVSARTIQSSGLYFAQLAFHFWITGSHTPSDGMGMYHSHPVGIGLVLVAALAVFLILWFSGAFRKPGDERMSFAKKTALTGIMLLFMSMNIFPWDRIQSLNSITASLVSSLQFPNRFLGWGTVCLVFLFGYCILLFLENGKEYGSRILVAAAFFGVVTSGIYLMDHVDSDQQYFKLYNEEGMGFGYISGAEYLIQGTDESLLTFDVAKAGSGLEITGYEKRSLGAVLECANYGESETFADLPLLMYKGYRAADIAGGQRLPVSFGENNVVRVSVPANYNGSIKVYFSSPLYWRISELVTLVFIVLSAVFGLRRCGHGEHGGAVRHSLVKRK